ncbi:MAG TPA: hypothetical protein VHG08_15705 [Longimicrobium sp.]|nr:hypothetical protein [Longimicrobium sp.]
MRKTIGIAALVAAAWAGSGCALQAQHAAAAPPSRQECEAAAQKAAAAPQSAEFHWALTYGGLARCGDTGAVALARALRQAGAIADSLLLGGVVVQASSSRHPQILQAALDLALDRSAPVPARVAGLQVALRQHDGRVALPGSVTQLSATAMGAFCRYDYLPHAHYASERTLPRGHAAAIAAAMRRIADDPAEPRPLRDLAGCVARKVGEPGR